MSPSMSDDEANQDKNLKSNENNSKKDTDYLIKMGDFFTSRVLPDTVIDKEVFTRIVSSLRSSSITSFNVTPLTTDNWSSWSKIMKSKFNLIGLWPLINNKIQDDVINTNEFASVDEVIRDILISSVSQSYQAIVFDSESGRDAWFNLIEHFEGNEYVKGLIVIQRLHVLKEKQTNDIRYIVNEFKSIINDLTKMYSLGDDLFWINYLLSLLPIQFQFVSSIIRNCKYTKLIDVYKHILDEYQVYEQNTSKSNLVCGLTNSKPNSNASYKKYKNKPAPKDHSKDHSNLYCEECKISGHVKETCIRRIKKLNAELKIKFDNSNDSSNQKSNNSKSSNKIKPNSNGGVKCIKESRQSEMINDKFNSDEVEQFKNNFVVCSIGTTDSDKVTLDSACSFHSFGTLNGCIGLMPVAGVSLDVANGSPAKVTGIGTYVFKSCTGKFLKFEGVRYSPDLKGNFASHGVLKKLGFKTIESDVGFDLYKEDELIVSAIQDEINNFPLQGQLVSGNVCSLISNSNLTIDEIYLKWHSILGHLNFGQLIKMSEQLNIKGKPSQLITCDVCLINKCVRMPFKRRKSEVDKPLRLIHSDVCGKINVPNLLGVSYFITFIDDYSRYLMVYLMKHKSEAIEKFKIFKSYIENQCDLKIKSIRTDGGTEYTGGEFVDLLESSGIQIQRTTPNSPAANGISERENRTLIDMTKTMLYAKNLKTYCWPYALLHACYIRNRVFTSSNNSIPLFRMFNSNPEFDKMIEFGDKVVAVNLNKENKFAPNGLVGLFFGYPENYSGYLIYIEADRKVMVSRDVYKMNQPEIDCKVNEEIILDYVHCPIDVMNSSGVNKVVQVPQIEIFACPNQMITSSENRSIQNDSYYSTQDYPSDHNDLSINENLSDQDDLPNDNTVSVDENLSVRDNSPINSELSINDNVQSDSSVQQSTTFQVNSRLNGNDQINSDAMFPPGTILKMNYTEERNFRLLYPNVDLQVLRFVPSSKKGKHRSFVVNSIKIPSNAKDAMTGPNADLWCPALVEEFDTLERNNTWVLVPRPKNKKVIGLMWVFATKFGIDGNLDSVRARIVALGCNQNVNFDLIDTYAPVLRACTIRFLFSFAARYNMKIYHIDIKKAFINSHLKEEVYTFQAPGFINKEKPNHVYLLKRALYGLKQAAKAFNDLLVDVLREYGFEPLLTEPCLFKLKSKFNVIVGTYVDDLPILVNDEQDYLAFRDFLITKFEISEKGIASQLVGYELSYHDNLIAVNQKSYIKSSLVRFEFSNTHPVSSPVVLDVHLEFENGDRSFDDVTKYQQMLGCLMYISNSTRPDICYIVNRLCRFMSSPLEKHLVVIKRIFRYLNGTDDFSLVYGLPKMHDVLCYADADFANDVRDSKSITGIVLMIFGGAVEWSSRKQVSVALATCESETLAIRSGCCITLFFRDLLNELQLADIVKDPSMIYNDNLSAVFSTKSGGCFQRNSHYRIKLNFIRDLIKRDLVQVEHQSGSEMVADLCTKPLSRSILDKLFRLMNFGLLKDVLDHH